MLRRNECRLNFKKSTGKNRRSQGVLNNPPATNGGSQEPATNRVKMETWIFFTFPTHLLGMLYQIFEFLLCAEAAPGPLYLGHVCQVRQFFLNFLETVKIWLCVIDLFIEKLVLKFGRNRSRNNEVITILNIWWKKTVNVIFGPLNSKFPDFRDFRKRIL